MTRRPFVLMSLVLTLLSSSQAQQPQALVKLIRVSPSGAWWLHRDCLAVFADGSYELYRELDNWSGKVVLKHEPYSGQLDSTEMEHLSTLLADPNLISVKSGFKGGWLRTPSEGQFDTLTLLINRASGKQFLLFSSPMGQIMSDRAWPSNRSPSNIWPAEILPVYTTPQIQPLLNWYKQMIKRKSTPDPSITLDCSRSWE